MSSSLSIGVSGLLAHQRMLDVVGNNLANLNTTGFKSKRTRFSDLIYVTQKPATAGTGTVIGGTNPVKLGSGVQVAQIATRFAQGGLTPTGESLDLAIQGEGFFVMHNGQQNVYTRDGAFSLDSDGIVVDPSTGFPVQRYGDIGETDGNASGFQVPGDLRIRVPLGVRIPGTATTSIAIAGNLDALSDVPAATHVETAQPFTESGAPATAATLLNDLDANLAPYAAGDVIELVGTNSLGTPVVGTFSVTATTTLGDLVNSIASEFPDSTVALDSEGNIEITANQEGYAPVSLSLIDDRNNAGSTSFEPSRLTTVTEGTGGSVVRSTVEVFDLQGGPRLVQLEYTKVGASEWRLEASIDPQDGVATRSTVESILFNEDGSIRQALGGQGNTEFTFQFAGQSTAQTIQLEFGSTGGFEGLTHVASDSSPTVSQNGYSPSALTGVDIKNDGIIEGIGSNGRRFEIAQIAIATFANQTGLVSIGNNAYLDSSNTGPAQIGTALSHERGAIRSDHLEGSNVDIAEEFTRLIVAQRGFSANARTITVSDEILEEVTNIVR